MKRLILLLTVSALILVSQAWRGAEVEPVQRNLRYTVDHWPAGAPPVRLVLLSDLHVGPPDMPPERIARLVDRVNALKPDCVLIAGDFVSDKWFWRSIPLAEAIAPLARLRPRIETIAVLGNHERWKGRREQAIVALADAGAHVLVNGATRCGALVIGGTGDLWSREARIPETLRAMRLVGGIPVLMSHNPDALANVRGIGLSLAGHTHCGQVSLPLLGPPITQSRFGKRFACGLIADHGRHMLVTAGIGTSSLPIRLGVPPDFWVINVGPRAPG